MRLMHRDVYKPLQWEFYKRKSRHKLNCSLECYECDTTFFLSPEVTHLLHVISASHTSVNLGPMTHNSCFPEHSNQYCKETCCVFFFSSPIAEWLGKNRKGRKKQKIRKKKKRINSSVNLSWAFPSNVLQKVPSCPGHRACRGFASKGQVLVGNINYTWLIWSKLRTNRPNHSKSQMHHHTLRPH